jgi:hypothetical protein
MMRGGILPAWRFALWRTLPAALLLLSAGLAQAERAPTPRTPEAGPRKPRWLTNLPGNWRIVRLPDSRLAGLLAGEAEGQYGVIARYSSDNGQTWEEAKFLFPLNRDMGSPEPLVDRNGELQLFFLKAREKKTDDDGSGMPMGIDIWHARTTGGRTQMSPPVEIWRGYCGSMNCELQLKSGRILFPFSYYTNSLWSNRGPGTEAFTYRGRGVCAVLYSDDDGKTWQLSPAKLRVSTPDLSTDEGAIEPVIAELRDGRAWMLIRAQHGRFYESFSTNGADWSLPRPTRILSSDSPAGLVRLDDGRLALLWNNCLRFPYAYGGRHVLHAAVSDDDGKTWRGFREVARNPRRDEPPPPRGDHGATYPIPMAANDGLIISTDGLPSPRYNLMIDPKWLLETTQQDDFTDGLEQWTAFGVQGVGLAPHPQKPDARVLQIRKTAPDWPAGAVWNFPSGASGRLRLRLQIREGFRGALLGLTDHYSVPFDDLDRFANLYNLELGPEGQMNGRKAFVPGRWHELELRWAGPTRRCQVFLDGKPLANLPLARETLGVCYLRLRSTASVTDPAGLWIESVEAEVQP